MQGEPTVVSADVPFVSSEMYNQFCCNAVHVFLVTTLLKSRSRNSRVQRGKRELGMTFTDTSRDAGKTDREGARYGSLVPTVKHTWGLQ